VAVVGDTATAEVVYLNEDFDLVSSPSKPRPDRMMARWTYVVGTKAVAQWACTAASRMATDLMDKAHPGSWKQMMEGQFRKAFSVSW
jgi:hypothetical protein